MGCVITKKIVLLVNGSPSNFFKASKGLRHGFFLSPYLFLFIIEGLGRLIMSFKQLGLIQRVKVYAGSFLSHQLFVDDVLLFGATLL